MSIIWVFFSTAPLNGIGENVFQHGFDFFAINHLQELLLQAEGIEAFLQVPFRCQGHLGPGCWLLAVSMVWESNVIFLVHHPKYPKTSKFKFASMI